MTINLNVPDIHELKPRITVFGVGGAGGNANRATEDASGEFGNASKLRRTAAQHNPRTRLGGKWGIREPVPDHLKNLPNTLTNDVGDGRTRHDLRRITVTVSGCRNRHQFADIRAAR